MTETASNFQSATQPGALFNADLFFTALESGAFTVLRFPEQDLPDVVYLEQLNSALYLDKPEVVDDYLMVMERVCMEAATPADSVDAIRRMLQEH